MQSIHTLTKHQKVVKHAKLIYLAYNNVLQVNSIKKFISKKPSPLIFF